MQYHGLMALQTGFLVAFTQLIPEHQVQLFGGLASVRVKVIMFTTAAALSPLTEAPPCRTCRWRT